MSRALVAGAALAALALAGCLHREGWTPEPTDADWHGCEVEARKAGTDDAGGFDYAAFGDCMRSRGYTR